LGPWLGTSSHQALLNKLKANKLIDRRRDNQPEDTLREFDVGPYETSVTSPAQPLKVYRPLPPTHGGGLERDHVPSSKSLKSRNPAGPKLAARQGMTIAISKDSHKKHSPTHGRARQDTEDLILGQPNPIKRKDYDSAHPASAFSRDADFMLNRTSNDPNPTHRLTQMGAYRTLFRLNTRVRAAAMPDTTPGGAGINPYAPAMIATHVPGPDADDFGSFTYQPDPDPNRTQGNEIAAAFRRRATRERFASD
jgi:hypothetical protein